MASVRDGMCLLWVQCDPSPPLGEVFSEHGPLRKSLTGRALLWLSPASSSSAEALDSSQTEDVSFIPDYQYARDGYYLDPGSNNTNATVNSTADCRRPLHHHDGYNSTCDYVQDMCGDVPVLFDYLSLAACSLPHAKWFAYIIMALWLFVLVSLLATTADYFFVPPLNVLAEKLQLTPAVAGITLLAVGNGAPDVFTAYAAIHGADDFPLQLSALLGASIFISTVVLGSVMLVAEVSAKTVKRVDMIRDILVYMVVVATVVGVSCDSKIELWESALFLAIYLIYIAIVVGLSFIQKYMARKAKILRVSEKTPLVNEELSASEPIVGMTASINEPDQDDREEEDELDPNELPGLTWPAKGHIGAKIQFVVEYPFSWLRWLSIPPCDERWNWQRRAFAVAFPLPAAIVLVIAAEGFGGMTMDVSFSHHNPNDTSNGTDADGCQSACFPVYGLVLIFGIALTVMTFFWSLRVKVMGGFFQAYLAFFAFIMSVAWMNIEANEVVALLETFGLVMGVDTAILGLTVLAIGNSVGDLVADTTVARKTPAMGVSSCFGSPLLNDVLGLGISLTAYCASHWPKPFEFKINDPKFAKVKLSWIFLGLSLVMSLGVFVFTKFSPPRWYAYVLYFVYALFMVLSVLNETNVMKIDL
ncbi:putative sodium/calcium exchanger 7 [Sycon ciliatum]|uniref:putative sodium/calcium exchanger 7 n=1 Tax=Sycon ciliatum TaxID=27933 RepID=UPI0031F6EB66